MPVRVVEVPVSGGVLRMDVAGEGPAVVLWHGWSLDRRMWRPQVEALSSRFTLVATDRRGFGETTAPPDLSREVDDIEAVLDALGVERCVLVGMSQGGRVALRFADRHPERLAGLALLSAPLDGYAPTPAPGEAVPLADYAVLAAAGRLDDLRTAWREHPLMHVPDGHDRSLVDAMVNGYRAEDLTIMPPQPMLDLVSRLDTIATPALVITGENESAWLHGAAETVATRMPDARRTVIEGAGHLASMTHATAFDALLSDFAGSLAPY